MARILMLVVCASLLSCTLASDSATTKPSGSTTTKHTTVHTTAAPSTTLPPTTSPPRTESPDLEMNNTFILYDGSEVCLMMMINMTVVYTYKNASNPNKTVTLLDPMDRIAEIYDGSYCQLGGPSASLTLRWWLEYNETITEPNDRFMTFKFTASQKPNKRHWTFDAVRFDVIYSPIDFRDSQSPSAPVISYKADGFFSDKVEYERGYQCLASQDHGFSNLTDTQITATVTVTDFRVQAFDFKKAGEFGNFRQCLADSGDGNKIVPIAVGVALAVLVIAVIIAFFISKLFNRRRQTSYETLN